MPASYVRAKVWDLGFATDFLGDLELIPSLHVAPTSSAADRNTMPDSTGILTGTRYGSPWPESDRSVRYVVAVILSILASSVDQKLQGTNRFG